MVQWIFVRGFLKWCFVRFLQSSILVVNIFLSHSLPIFFFPLFSFHYFLSVDRNMYHKQYSSLLTQWMSHVHSYRLNRDWIEFILQVYWLTKLNEKEVIWMLAWWMSQSASQCNPSHRETKPECNSLKLPFFARPFPSTNPWLLCFEIIFLRSDSLCVDCTLSFHLIHI